MSRLVALSRAAELPGEECSLVRGSLVGLLGFAFLVGPSTKVLLSFLRAVPTVDCLPVRSMQCPDYAAEHVLP